MNKRLIIALALLMMFCFVSGASANKFSTGNWIIDDDSVLKPKQSATTDVVGMQAIYQRSTTSDTLLATDTGKIISISNIPSHDIVFTLPTAAKGLTYKFVTAVSGTDLTGNVILKPASTDAFRGVVNSAAATTFAAGDRVASPGTTGDTLEILCAETLYWDVISIRGTWTDSN